MEKIALNAHGQLLKAFFFLQTRLKQLSTFAKPGHFVRVLSIHSTFGEHEDKLVILVLNITFLPACLSIRDGHFREFLGPKRQSASSKPHNFYLEN